jgi:hypothetical protein
MTRGYEKIRNASDDELRRLLESANRDPIALQVLAEMHHRDNQRTNAEMLNLTSEVRTLTKCVTVLTVRQCQLR